MAPQTRARDRRLRQSTGTTGTSTSREYHSSPIPQQVRFPARGKVVKTYGKRTPRTALRQQTLTQIGFPLSMQPETDGSELLVEPLELDEEETTAVPTTAKTRKGGRGSKRRKTMGDTPNASSSSSAFHTQKITQFLLSSAVKGEDGEDEDGKGDSLIKDSQDEDDDGEEEDNMMDDTFDFLPPKEEGSPELVSEKKKAVTVGRKMRSSVSGKGKGKGKAKEETQEEASGEVSAVPQTPSTKRIKVNVDEVPSSQPTPFTPLIGYSPIGPYRSPLKNKSTNTAGGALPAAITTETHIHTPKLPRHLEIQDSYSIGGGSSPFSIHQSSPSPLKKTPMSIRSKPKPMPKRQPLAELPVPEDEDDDTESGVEEEQDGTPTKPRTGSSSAVKKGTTSSSGGGKKRAFVEVPDSEDDDDDDLVSFAGSSSSPAMMSNRVAKTPTSQRISVSLPPPDSAKENRTPKPAADEKKMEEEDEEMEEPPGTPTPIARRSELRTREEVPSSSAEDDMGYESDEGVLSPVPSSIPQASRVGLGSDRQRAAVEQPTADTSQVARTPTTKRRVQIELPSMSGDEEVASDDVEEEVLKETPRRKPAISTTTKKPSPPSATGGRRKVVQIELPRPTSTTTKAAEQPAADEEEEILKETPRRNDKTTRFSNPKIPPRQPQKSSPTSGPIVGRSQHRSQRHTQRSQLYSQGLESQRVPLEVIRAMGSPSDTSDVFVTISPQRLEEIIGGIRDHEFRPHVLPGVRAWFYATEPVNEVRYMAELGQPAKKPGEVDAKMGVGNGEFNRGESFWEGSTMSGSVPGGSASSVVGGSSGSSGSGHGELNKFAYKLMQVYQLNNPVKKDELEEHGFGKGLPTRWRLLPPAAVGDLLANLRCALFAEEGDDEQDDGEGGLEAIEEEGEEEDVDEEMGEAAAEETAEESQPDHGVTVSQELEQQLRSDMIRSTQMQSLSDDAAAAARMPPGEGGGEGLLRHDSTMITSSSPQRPPPHPAAPAARVTSSGGSKNTRSTGQLRMTVTKVTKKQVTTAKRYQFAELEMEEDEDDEDLDLNKGGMKTPPPARTAPHSRSTGASASASKSSTTSRKSSGGSRSTSQQTTQTQTQTQAQSQSQSQIQTRQTRRYSQRLTSSQQELVESQTKTTTKKALQEKASMPPPPSPAKARGRGGSNKITTSALAKLNKTSTIGFGAGHNNPNYNTARPSQATTVSGGPSSPIIPPSRPDEEEEKGEEEQEEFSLPQLPGAGRGRGRGTNRSGRGRGSKVPSQLHSESLTASECTESASSVVRPALPDEVDDSHILLSSSSIQEGSGNVTPRAMSKGRRTPGSGRTPGSARRRGGLGRLPLSSQGMASLGPDSLLMDVEGVRAPPELRGLRGLDSEVDEDETASEDDGDLN